MCGKSPTEEAEQRLKCLVETTDGFVIAEKDLEIRGPGEFFGTRQAGLPALRVANLIRDREILEIARRAAVSYVQNPPPPDVFREFVANLKTNWQRRYGLVAVG
jgi:ATP-dependent DNA helicase RecG